MTRALLLDSHVPRTFWPEALSSDAYLLNNLPTHILNFKTPLDIFTTQNKIPPPLTLEPRVFGCSVLVHIPKQNRSKFSPCSIKCVFLGYGKNQKGYRCYDPKSKRLFITLNYDFVEAEYFYTQLSSQGEETHSQPISDPLSWYPTPNLEPNLSMPLPNLVTEIGPTEDASCSTTEPSTESHVQPHESGDTAQPFSSPVIHEVSDTDNSIPTLDTDHSRQETETPLESPEYSRMSFELPLRSIRGVPPRRYSPNWRGPKTRYYVANLMQGQLTKMARAFETTLYEEVDIP